MAPRTLTPSALTVSPDLKGLSLASPFRRLAAFVIDWIILVPPTIIVVFSSVFLILRISDPVGYRALQMYSHGQVGDDSLKHLAPLLVRADAEGLPGSVIKAVEEGDNEGAAKILASWEIDIAVQIGTNPPPLKPGQIRLEVRKLIPGALRGIVTWFVAAFYFTLLTAGKIRGTLGKRIMGIQVVRLDGKNLTIWQSFERFGGYLASAGTAVLGVFDLWRDPNRRLAHDRIAHTVVLRRVRSPKEKEESAEDQV